MALPKLGYPTYELELPSTGKTIKYRPFLVKEEKVLLMALESKDEKQVIGAVKDLIKNCVITRIKVESLPSFDLEYLFLKIRGASIGENITLTVTCQDDNETQVEANINIDDVEIFKPEGHDKKIMFDDKTGLVMKYPSMKEFVDREAKDPNGRFFVGTPRSSDGSLLFLQHLIHKMKRYMIQAPLQKRNFVHLWIV